MSRLPPTLLRFVTSAASVLVLGLSALACAEPPSTDEVAGTALHPVGSIEVSDPVLVASHAQIAAVSPPGVPILDAPPVSFIVGGERRWLVSAVKWFQNPDLTDDFHVYHSLVSGSLEHPFQQLLSTKQQWDVFTSTAGFPGRWWIVNTYQDSAGILAFVHVEFADGLTSNGAKLQFGRARLGLAWSTDGGASFRYLGNIVVPRNDPADFNVEGAPYVIKEGQFHVYFRDYDGISVARAPVADVIAAAQNGATPTFQKWDNGSWTPGIGGSASPLSLTGISHSDAAYSTRTGKYYLATTTQKNGSEPSRIQLYQSDDAIQWELAQSLFPLHAAGLGWQYLSIVDASGSDNGSVGERFYIYCGKDPINTASSELYRIEVNLGDGGGGGGGGGGPQPGYQGVFRVGDAVCYSNGSVYCQYDTWASFTCATGLGSVDTVTAFSEFPDDLVHGGVCQVSPCAGSQPPHVGIFRVGPDLYYSNGSVYCQYDSWPHFQCATGLTDLSAVASFASVPGGLTPGGTCQIPESCS